MTALRTRRMRPGRLLAAVMAVAVAALGAGAAAAAAPQLGGQAPGFYRMMIGRIEVTALLDGVDALPAGKLLMHLEAAAIDRQLGRAFLTDPVATSVNAFLINTGDKLVLIDTGAGQLLGPDLGRLQDNLRAAGYRPEQVDEIYLTHLHPDHVGGLSAGGAALFPHALVRAARTEAEYWLSPMRLAAAPPEQQPGYRHAAEALAPYVAAGRFSSFEDGAALVAGIRALPSHGHTPGHTCYVVESDGAQLLVWGDLVHVGAVQFAHPAVTIRFDSDPAAAAAQRARLLKEAAAGRWWIAGAHLPFPGLGHVRAAGSGYRWVPANYTIPH